MLQLVKTVAAAVIAWVVAVEVLSLPQSFLAPWAALLVVHPTVYRSLARGAQQAAAAVVGVLLAFAAGAVLGTGTASLALVLLVGARVRRAAARAGGVDHRGGDRARRAAHGLQRRRRLLLARLADTFVGIAVGLAVNVAVWPPLRDRVAARRIDRLDDRLGALLADMSGDLRECRGTPDPERWVERTRELDHGIDEAWADVRHARESGRLNPRRQAARRVSDTRDLGDVLVGLEQAVADTRSMARTIGRAGAIADWEPGFRDAWIEMLARAGARRQRRRRRRACAPCAPTWSRWPARRRRRAARPRRARGQPAQHPRGDGARRRRAAGPRARTVTWRELSISADPRVSLV